MKPTRIRTVLQRIGMLFLCAALLLPQVSLAAGTKNSPGSDIRVLLTRLNLADEAWMTLEGRYLARCADGTELMLPAGAQVTVCYELVLTGSGEGSGSSLKYQDTNLNEKAKTGELLTVSVRYKDPTADKSQLLEYPLKDNGISNREDFNFICGVIEASMVMRNSEYKGSATFDSAYQLAKSGANNDRFREEFCELLTKLGADH